MLESPQSFQVSRDGIVHEATVTWRYDEAWVVAVSSAELGAVEKRADDAFEALCLVREELEPLGWRLGLAGAQVDVWPSGMARDQGGGLRAYRWRNEQVEGLVDTFAPVDPATVTTVDEQRSAADRFYEAARGSAAAAADAGDAAAESSSLFQRWRSRWRRSR